MTLTAYRSAWATDDVQVFRQTIARFIEKELVPRQASWRRQHRPDPEAWIAAGAIGMLLPDVPETYGGGGGSFAHQAIVSEELARAGVPFGASLQSIVAHYILAYANEKQRQAWLPRMARGELVAAIAMTEPGAGSDLQGLRTTARKDGDDYVLNGSKTFITNAATAGLVCVAAKTDAKAPAFRGISLFAVETHDRPGYRVGPPLEKVGMHETDTCELSFEDVRVPAANLLGGAEGRGLPQMLERLSYERLTVAIAAVASAEKAVDLTTRHVKERTAFGKPLLELQNTRFVLAECVTEAHIGRVFLDHCIERFIAGTLDDTTTAMAKYWLTERQFRIVDACVQMHGGYGYMTDYPIARMWADTRALRIYAGANEVMKELIACSL
jgi:acyl-CoA dehydrogenase